MLRFATISVAFSGTTPLFLYNLNCEHVETTPIKPFSNLHTSRVLLFVVFFPLSIRFVLCHLFFNTVLKVKGGILSSSAISFNFFSLNTHHRIFFKVINLFAINSALRLSPLVLAIKKSHETIM